jgi:hypothetical protein
MQLFPNFTEFAWGAPLLLFCQLSKRAQITFGVVSIQKVISYGILIISACGNNERRSYFLIPLVELKLKIKMEVSSG